MNRFLLDRRKARGCATKPWSFIPETSQNSAVVPLYESARMFFIQNPSGFVPDETETLWRSKPIGQRLNRPVNAAEDR